VCNFESASVLRIPEVLEFNQPSSSKDITQLTGVALDGVPLYTGSTLQYGVDAFYPTNFQLKFTPDE